MLSKQSVVDHILAGPSRHFEKNGIAFAPSNIALCKYWGKRNELLNLPETSSLSLSLGTLGATIQISPSTLLQDEVWLNGTQQAHELTAIQRLTDFLNLFRHAPQFYYRLDIQINIPVAAGLASSACLFAALTMALNDAYQWQLSPTQLSILARLGSGSASRSIFSGFVEWQRGDATDGMDSHAIPLDFTWPELRWGLVLISTASKKISSRDGMRHTRDTSFLFPHWINQTQQTLQTIKASLQEKDWDLLGQTMETNALFMHTLAQTANPPVCYTTPATLEAQQIVWDLRHQGHAVYFTQDAGPNIKLLFRAQDATVVSHAFPDIQIINPFTKANAS